MEAEKGCMAELNCFMPIFHGMGLKQNMCRNRRLVVIILLVGVCMGKSTKCSLGFARKGAPASLATCCGNLDAALDVHICMHMMHAHL